MRRLRGLAKAIKWAVIMTAVRLVFPAKYLRGRHFEESRIGWIWAWRAILWQKILGFNRGVPWPVSPLIIVGSAQNITFDMDDLNNFQGVGCYFQSSRGKIHIGKGTWIAPNVGIITSNHDPADLDAHLPGEDVIIGDGCWIGMNAVLLPGVRLGDRTTVGAGAVVTQSFPEGHCIIGGVPARLIKRLRATTEAALAQGGSGVVEQGPSCSA